MSGPDDRPRRFPLGLAQVATVKPSNDRLLRPQAHMQLIERERKHQGAPQGLGLDSPKVRARMVARLRGDGIGHDGVLAAFERVPRHLFVDTALVNQAYEDTSLPIGLGQTISKPSVVAAMMQLLCERPGLAPEARLGARPLGACLEIGTGCGYQAALLACLATRVASIERLRELHLKARRHLDQLSGMVSPWADIRLVHGDGRLGHGPHAPYDTIIAAAGGEDVPAAWTDQLATGGRLVAPVAGAAGAQVLTIVDRLPDGTLKRTQSGAVLFVPLKSGLA